MRCKERNRCLIHFHVAKEAYNKVIPLKEPLPTIPAFQPLLDAIWRAQQAPKSLTAQTLLDTEIATLNEATAPRWGEE
jgi:hypothetical protein